MELLSYLLNMLAVLFTLFRGYVSFSQTTGNPTGFWIGDPFAEIVLLFVAMLCIVMIFKRNLLFASIYLGVNFAYFGYGISTLMGNSSPTAMFDMLVMFVGIIIALLNFIDVLFNKNRKGSTKDNKTDWFYGTHNYEREYDERADRNQYKF